MYGAIIGDIIGSVYERHNVKTEDFPLFSKDSRFTDDTVLIVAVMEKLISDKKSGTDKHGRRNYASWYRHYYRRYPNAGFGQMFSDWAEANSDTIQRSYGNGAAMRVSPIGYAFEREKDVLSEVEKSCFYTHNNAEAVDHAKAAALAVFYAKHGYDKTEIKNGIIKKTGIKLSFTLDEIRPSYVFDSRSKNSVPQAIEAFLESTDYESAVRKAISVGGDSDTIACIAGGIAEAYYGEIPAYIMSKAKSCIDGTLKDVIRNFYDIYR